MKLTCPFCDGEGEVRPSIFKKLQECSHCKGKGTIDMKEFKMDIVVELDGVAGFLYAAMIGIASKANSWKRKNEDEIRSNIFEHGLVDLWRVLIKKDAVVLDPNTKAELLRNIKQVEEESKS